jgi:hypothetical protein
MSEIRNVHQLIELLEKSRDLLEYHARLAGSLQELARDLNNAASCARSLLWREYPARANVQLALDLLNEITPHTAKRTILSLVDAARNVLLAINDLDMLYNPHEQDPDEMIE